MNKDVPQHSGPGILEKFIFRQNWCLFETRLLIEVKRTVVLFIFLNSFSTRTVIVLPFRIGVFVCYLIFQKLLSYQFNREALNFSQKQRDKVLNIPARPNILCYSKSVKTCTAPAHPCHFLMLRILAKQVPLHWLHMENTEKDDH